MTANTYSIIFKSEAWQPHTGHHWNYNQRVGWKEGWNSEETDSYNAAITTFFFTANPKSVITAAASYGRDEELLEVVLLVVAALFSTSPLLFFPAPAGIWERKQVFTQLCCKCTYNDQMAVQRYMKLLTTCYRVMVDLNFAAQM